MTETGRPERDETLRPRQRSTREGEHDGHENDSDGEEDDQDGHVQEMVEDGLVVGAAAGAGIVAAPLVAQAALGIVGFSAQGVVAGTAAAAIQSSIGNVAAGSVFATCQSIAMGGAFPPLGLAIGAAVLGGCAYRFVWKKRLEDQARARQAELEAEDHRSIELRDNRTTTRAGAEKK